MKRFSIDCYGHQPTIEEMRAEKSEKYKELKDKRGTLEYDEYFLRYRPADSKEDKREKNLSRMSNNKASKMGKTSKTKQVKTKQVKTKQVKTSKTKQVKVKKTKKRRRRQQGFFF